MATPLTKRAKEKKLRPARSNSTASTTLYERKLSDLAFADDVALHENSIAQSQDQLDAYKNSAATVGLRLNTKKTEQMQPNQPQGATTTKLFSDNQEIA